MSAIKNKIKILHIQETIGYGGVERRRLSLAKHLDKCLFEQKFVCTFEKGVIPEEIRKEGWELISIGKFKNPFHWSQHKKIQQIIDEYKPDVIHGAVFEGVTMVAINGWLKRVPIIIIEETSDPQNRSWRANLLIKIFAMLSTKVIGVSESVSREYLIEKIGVSKNKVLTINNGVEIPRNVAKEEIRQFKKKMGIKDSDFIVGSIGRMNQDSHKRYSDLIRAFALFSKDKEFAKLLLVGEGQEKLFYENMAIDLGIRDRVLFVGYQSDTAIYYELMDVFVLMSAREAFGLVLAEAMLHKLPIIATKVGGMKYIVDDDKTGFLVEVGDSKDVAMKLNYLFVNREAREKMGNLGYDKAFKTYREDLYVKNIENLYLKLAK